MNSNKAGSPKNGGYQSIGVGNSAVVSKDVTRGGSGVGGASGEKSTGEVPGAGSAFTAILNERPNLSCTRNCGPERSPSVMGSTSIPVISMADRMTGKV